MPRNVRAYREELARLVERAAAISSPGAVVTLVVRLPGDDNLSAVTTEPLADGLERLAVLLAKTRV